MYVCIHVLDVRQTINVTTSSCCVPLHQQPDFQKYEIFDTHINHDSEY